MFSLVTVISQEHPQHLQLSAMRPFLYPWRAPGDMSTLQLGFPGQLDKLALARLELVY